MIAKKKKISVIAICMTLIICLFSGCGSGADKDKDKKEGEGKKLKVVTTIFPAYDWSKKMLGKNAKNADITMLLDDGVDLHSYQPSAKDIAKISKCDVFVYVGGESDEWVKDALKEATNKKMIVINLMSKLGKSVKNEEVKEGMQAEHDHDHDKDKDHDHDKDKDHDHEHGEEPEKDEHVWLSLKNAKVCCAAISKALQKVDPENKDLYKQNLKDYSKELRLTQIGRASCRERV